MASEVIHGVFVSSTYEDLREERAAVQMALLKLHCFPIGMELFGSANAETWEFIKQQIDECDYYVVIIADRYGSLAEDGLSFTEKEYDYARETGKPCLAFVHGARGSIARQMTEQDPEKRTKLEAFISKVRRFPVTSFKTTDELAKEVIVSFVNERGRNPRPGYVRADTVADPKKYADLLEQQVSLEKTIASLQAQPSQRFPNADNVVTLRINDPRGKHAADYNAPYLTLFIWIADSIVDGFDDREKISDRVANKVLGRPDVNAFWGRFRDSEEWYAIIRQLVAWRLLKTTVVQRAGSNGNTRNVVTVDLTDYGRDQYTLLMAQ